ncbi:hypothetical protein N7A96_002331 [Escherichia coli]|nr:hypothetical protein [Escherichia coli]EKR8898198.1 hypothetical protein [Escherichia coli]
MSDNNLRLQVILNAVDKLTRPFRSAQASSRELAAAVKKSRDAIKQLDQAGSSLDSFRKLQAENQKLGDRLNYARQRANLLSQELGAMGPPSQRQVVALGRQRLAVQRLEERQKKLQQQTALVRAELYRAGISAKDDAGATARLARETSRYNQELSKQEARLKRLGEAGTVLRVLASGPLAMLRVALYAISGLLGALLSPIGLVVTALAGVALVVWKYWQPITAFLGGVVEGFKAAAGPISAAFEPLKPVFQWIGDKVQALWGWFTDLLTPVKSTSAELQSAAAMGRRFGEALAEGLNMVMHPLDSLKSGVSWLLEKLGIVSKEAAKAKLPESVTRQQPATVNADGKVMMPSGGFPSWGYGFAGMYDSGGYIPRGQFGIVGENGPEIVNGPANVTSRRNTAALAAVVAGMMGVAAAPAELPPLHPLALPAKGGEAIVSRAATVPLVQRIEAPTQIIIQTQPGQSAQDIAREVARQLDERERRLKAKARSNYSDQGGYDA